MRAGSLPAASIELMSRSDTILFVTRNPLAQDHYYRSPWRRRLLSQTSHSCLETFRGQCNQFYFEFPLNMEIRKVINTCNGVCGAVDTLRTIFWRSRGGNFQLVMTGDVSPPLDVLRADDVDADSDTIFKGEPGDFHYSVYIIRPAKGDTRLIIRVYHARYDGISLAYQMRLVAIIYNNEYEVPEVCRLGSYVQYANFRQSSGRTTGSLS